MNKFKPISSDHHQMSLAVGVPKSCVHRGTGDTIPDLFPTVRGGVPSSEVPGEGFPTKCDLSYCAFDVTYPV